MFRAATPGGSKPCTSVRTLPTSSAVDAAPLGELFELGAQVAVLVEVADDLVPDPPDGGVLGGEAQLLVEMVGQRDLVPDDVLERQVLAIFLRDERALLVVVVGRDHRGEIERQLVRLALAGRRGVRRHLLDRRRRRRVGGHRRVSRAASPACPA